METTEKLALPYIIAAQAQKHVTHNEALRMLDALTQIGVESRTATAPPAEPDAGACWIVPASGTGGAFADHENEVAAFQDGAFAFYPPQSGWLAFVRDEGVLAVFDGTAWAIAGTAGSSVEQFGINATASPAQRLAVSSDTALFTADAGGSHRLILNRAGASDTASLLYQSGFEGRAEFGLTGSEDFSVRTSPQSGAWQDALVLERATGLGAFVTSADPNDLLVNGSFAINQRVFGGGALAADVFGYDRWKGGVGGADVSRSGTTVTLASGSLVQTVEGLSEGVSDAVFGVAGLTGGTLRVMVAGTSADLTPGTGPQFAAFSSLPTGPVEVVIEAPSGAVSFERLSLAAGTIRRMPAQRDAATELRLCQRTFATSYDLGTVPADGAGTDGLHAALCQADGNITSQRIALPVPMRTAPTVTFFAPNTGQPTQAGAWQLVGPAANYVNAPNPSLAEVTQSAFSVEAALAGTTAGSGFLMCGGWSAEAEF